MSEDQVTPPPAPVPVLSGLSATEFVTLSRAGFLPRGLVIGTSVYRIGKSVFGGELTRTGHAQAIAWRLAVSRLRAQAQALGAEGVVGVRLSVEQHRWRTGQWVAKIVAVGTAVAFDAAHAPSEFRGAPSLRLSQGPFTSGLGGQELVTLLQAGYRPISLALGSCVIEACGGAGAVSVSPLTWVRGSTDWQDELVGLSMKLMDAREAAMRGLERDLGAEYRGVDAPEGVVGVKVEQRIATYEIEMPSAPYADGSVMSRPYLVEQTFVEFTAVGTAIARLQAGDPRRAATPPTPVVVVPLDR